MLCGIVVTFLIASYGNFRRQKVLAAEIPELSSALLRNMNLTMNETKFTFGSQDVDIGNIYADDNAGKVRHGPVDIQMNNVYPENPDGTNIYGPILIQENNTYLGSNKTATYDPTVIRKGNVYPKNPGKNDIHKSIIIRDHNTYATNITNNSRVEADGNQTSDADLKELSGINDTVNSIIPKKDKVYPSIFRTKDVIGATIIPDTKSRANETLEYLLEHQINSVEDSPTTKINTTNTPSSNKDLNSIVENRDVAQNNTESQASLAKLNSSSKQLSLPFQFYYYFLNVLIIYYSL